MCAFHVTRLFRLPNVSVARASLAIALGVMLLAAGCGGSSGPGTAGNSTRGNGGGNEEIVIAMLPKLVNIAYFEACQRGAEQAAADLGIKLIYDGPTEPSGAEQNKFIDVWIRQGVNAICLAPNNPKTVIPFVQKAQARGIKILTWDTDAPESGRDLMVNQVDDRQLAEALVDDMARQMNSQGQWAIAIASLDAANLNSWRRIAEEYAASKYPDLELVDTVVTREDEDVARQQVETILNKWPELKGIIAFDSNSVPGAAEALKRTGKAGKVALTGNSTPERMRPYIDEGILESFYLWDPRALGNLTVRLAHALVRGEPVAPGGQFGDHRPLVFSPQDESMIILSEPIRFTKGNIDQYDFGI